MAQLENKVVSCKAVLLDIEGTTTPISFVKNVLFPYAVDNVKSYLDTHWNETDCLNVIKQLREQLHSKYDVINLIGFNSHLGGLTGLLITGIVHIKINGVYESKTEHDFLLVCVHAAAAINQANTDGIEIPSSEEASVKKIKQSVTDYVKLLISKDRKVTPLKDLQGFIWREAYQSGNIKGQLFKDVPEVLADWYKKGIKIYTYSSGSVEAQKLLFEYSDAGNILNYFSGHFDTRIGNKRDSSSYISISSQLQFPPAQILFITDVADEARAAICSGMQSLITIRPGNAQLSQSEMKEFELQTISSLNNITIVN